jgi:hypothetical protein
MRTNEGIEMSEKIQQTLHEKLERQAKHGVGDDWTAGYVAAMSEALHLIVREDGMNLTCCTTFDRASKGHGNAIEEQS